MHLVSFHNTLWTLRAFRFHYSVVYPIGPSSGRTLTPFDRDPLHGSFAVNEALQTMTTFWAIVLIWLAIQLPLAFIIGKAMRFGRVGYETRPQRAASKANSHSSLVLMMSPR